MSAQNTASTMPLTTSRNSYKQFLNLLQQLPFFEVATTTYNYLISAAFSGIFTDFWKFSNDFDSFCRKSSKFRWIFTKFDAKIDEIREKMQVFDEKNKILWENPKIVDEI